MKKRNLLIIAIAILGLAKITRAQTVPFYVPTNGLVAWWPFNGNTNDESGSGNNGTNNGASLTTDRFGNANKAYSFNGTSSYINCPSGTTTSLNVIGNISYCFWLKTSQTSTGLITAFGEEQVVGGGYLAGVNDGGATLGKLGYAISGTNWASSTIPLNNNNWRFIVITLSNDTMRLYIDNVLNKQSTGITPTYSWTGIRRIGVANYVLNGFFQGDLDDIGIWNRALSQMEINNLYTGNICYQNITVTDTLVINTNITGFNPITYQNTIKIYPNPTNDHITIDNGNIANLTGYQIKITNSLSQQVFQSAITQQQFYVDLSTWTGNGIYFVHIIDGQGNTIDIKKIVLQ